MESSSTINKMLAGNKIFVPSYQRAYSWETPSGQKNQKTQTDVFLSDLVDYNKSSAIAPYYFGHFLFEEKSDSYFGVYRWATKINYNCNFSFSIIYSFKSY